MLQQALWVAGLVLAGVLVARLAATRLYRLYVWFFVFLCFEITRSLVMFPLKPNSDSYGWIFVSSQPVTWLLYILIVLELYSLALREHRGIATLSRWTLSAALVVAIGISALTLSPDLARITSRNKVLLYYSAIERGLVFSLVLFLILITTFLIWFPVSIRRNVVLHATVYSVYFLSSATALFIRNVVGYHANRAINAILLCVDLVCFSLWIAWLNRRGEEHLVVVRRRWQPEDEVNLVRHLDALNATLLRRPRP